MKSVWNTGREEMAGRMLAFAANEYYAASVASGFEINEVECSARVLTIKFKKIGEKE